MSCPPFHFFHVHLLHCTHWQLFYEMTKYVKTTQQQLNPLNETCFWFKCDLAFIDFTCSSDYLYMLRNLIH